jgi:hypothetical protein
MAIYPRRCELDPSGAHWSLVDFDWLPPSVRCGDFVVKVGYPQRGFRRDVLASSWLIDGRQRWK